MFSWYKNKNSIKNTRVFNITDHSLAVLNKLIALYSIFIIALIPVVKHLMATTEDKDITIGEAAVFIVQTITTTGYGDLLPFHSYPMKLLSIVLMISGTLTIFLIAGTLMATVVERRISPKAQTFTNKSGHVIFTHYNEVVDRTIKLLENINVPYVVAAKEQTEALEILQKGIDCVCADPSYDDGLVRLGVQNAQLVVAANDDTTNINIILGVSTMCCTPVLAVMENETRAQLAYTAGAKHVVVIEETLGVQLVDWIYADASPTEFLNLIDVDVSPQIMKQLKPSIIHIGVRSKFKGKTIGEAEIRTHTGATVVAVWHADGSINTPSADTVLDETTLIVLGPHDSVDRFAAFIGGPGPGEHVVLVGAGRVGHQAGRRLNQCGISPCVIDIKKRHLGFDGQLIMGDSTRSHILNEARIRETDTLIVTINNDSQNIFIVLAGRQINPELNIVARAVNMQAIDRLHQAGANHVLSESILGSQLLQVAMVEIGVLPKVLNYVIREIIWQGKSLSIRELGEMQKENIKVVCVVRDEEILEPMAEFVLQPNDRLVAMGLPGSINGLRELAK